MSEPDLVGRTLGKRYLVRRVIGEGGMGAVYEVEHLFTKQIGALKLLHRSFAALPDVVERFVREASAAGRIGSPHIVTTLDAGEFDTGEPYMFMELLDGLPVSELIRKNGRLAFDEALAIASQAADGLGAAHAAGIVHRDIKPENLFFCRGEPPFVKILDFGISKFGPQHGGDHRLTKEGSALGTPYYMSPEQVVGTRDIDARADVYALGVVLYECVTGKVPFDADSLPALSVRIHEGDYEPASRVRRDAPIGFDVLIARAMALSPDDRFESMAAFREALSTLKSAPAPLSAPRIAPAEARTARGTSGRAADVRSPGTRGVAVVGAAFLGIGLVWMLTRSISTAARPETEPAARPSVSAPAPEPVVTRPVTVASVTPESSAARAKVPAPASAASGAPSPPVRKRPALSGSASPAKRDGLSEDNPFGAPP